MTTEASEISDAATRRAHVHQMWASVAPAWAEHSDYADRRGTVLTEKMLAFAALAPGERVLELACAGGGVGLAAARLVEPGGEVVLTDVVPEMTAIAAQRAAERGLGNVRTFERDLDDIAEPEASYDVVLCREGLMFAFDPAHAVRDIARILRPGGRVALGVWGPRARNPWLGLVFDAVSAELGSPMPPPGLPTPFSLDDAGRVETMLADAGLRDVAVTEVNTPLRTSSYEEWWQRTSSLAGPLTNVLAIMAPAARHGLQERLAQAVRPYETSAGLEFPGVSLLATGRRG
jgi:ubiquinone/menaquinone biosynthesis C-methylase UbiE